MAAITLGMNTNAAYVEPAPEAAATELSQSPNSNDLVSDYYHNTHIVRDFNIVYHNIIYLLQVISMEWGNFKSPHLPLTPFDVCLDDESSNPGSGV